MSKATTHEQRKFIENKVKEGWTSLSIAKSLGISIKTVNKWRQRIKKKQSGFANGSPQTRRFIK